MTKIAEPFQFETALKKLEALVSNMENETLPLEESLSHFEQGVALIKACQKALIEAEQKVQVITQQQMQESKT